MAARIKEIGKVSYLPLHKVKRKWSDRVKIVELPLFNSYVFVNVAEHELSSLLSIQGVARVVYYLRKPAVVRDYEIEAIKEFISLAGLNEIVHTGDFVTVSDGILKDKGGKVLFVTEKEVVLYLEELGAKISVKKEMVEKVVKK